MRSPLLRWLSFRVRVICILVFGAATLLPPYVPRSARAFDDVPVTAQQFLFVEDGFLLKSSSLGTQGSRLAYGEGLIHRVADGEGLQTVAKRYGISTETIRWANNLSAAPTLKPGQELVILPVDGVLHTVKSGETLVRISQLYDVPLEDITRQNRVQSNRIIAGQQLIVPGGKPLPAGGSVVAAGDLRFGDRLTGKDVTIRLSSGGGEQPGSGPAVGAAITQTVLQMPCADCFVTQYFRAGHYAMDIQTRGGGPIFAAEGGVVIRADKGWNGGYGNVIEVDHGNGLVTLYSHNKELYVKEGDTVQRGQRIAWMGNTGLVHGPTGIHVHFEVRVNGVKKNPLLYLE